MDKVKEFVEKYQKNDKTGHEMFHVCRVVKMAEYIAKKEGGDIKLIQLSAWLHDVGDYKLHNGIDRTEELITEFCELNSEHFHYTERIIAIVNQVSYKGGFNEKPTSIEAKIVQDADRLDAIGAIGIARTFAYGGSKNSLIYDGTKEFQDSKSVEEYKQKRNTTIHHFYDKLLKLKHLMNTETAKKIAEERHLFMESYLKQFFDEWDFERKY
ncbi:MAG: HD domain-containing protein [Flavobacteriales bacterium]|nr:HD domain-containing protein [Flavobacteriales bacterium]